MQQMIETAIVIAKEAGTILMNYYQKKLPIRHKLNDAENFLTPADEEADIFIRRRLKEEFPDDAILSEENSEIPKDYSARVWMVDPLDGTGYFVNGQDGFSVIIGLCLKGVPTLGVVYAPAREELYFAEKGKGAFYQDRHHPLQATSCSTLSQARLVIRASKGREREVDKIVQKLSAKEKIKEGSSALKLAMIASGKAEFHLSTAQRTSKWDTCGVQVILEEAGGKLTYIDGTDLNYTQKSVLWHKPYVASNGAIHQKVLNQIQKIICASSD